LSHNPVLGLGSLLARRWRLTAISAVVLLAVVAVLLTSTASRRRAAIQVAAITATSAVREARDADAMTYAPGELASAEDALRDALTERRAQETRLWPVPDAVRVGAAYADAERAARRAAVLARDRHATAVRTTASMIEQAAGRWRPLGWRPPSDWIATAAACWRGRIWPGRGSRLPARGRPRRQRCRRALRWTWPPGCATTLQRWPHATPTPDACPVAPLEGRHDCLVAAGGRAAAVVVKEAHLLTLFVRGNPVRTYRADLGFNWIADKSRAGDDATPEGRYHIVSRRSGGAFYKALLLDYPNAEDRAEFSRARRNGDLPRSAGIGGLIEIHGEGGRGRDWTNGCVALTNTDIDDLFARVGVSTPVTIVGSDNFGPIAEFAAQHRGDGARR
jgi:hypothetical protein